MRLCRESSLLLVLLAATATPALAQASDFRSSCAGGGVVFSGIPTERITVGQDPSTEVREVDPAEASRFQVVISCERERLVYSSRDGVPVRYHSSGCYGVLSAGSAGQIHFEVPELCSSVDGAAVGYAEILRTGVFQVIYRGRVTFWRDPHDAR